MSRSLEARASAGASPQDKQRARSVESSPRERGAAVLREGARPASTQATRETRQTERRQKARETLGVQRAGQGLPAGGRGLPGTEATPRDATGTGAHRSRQTHKGHHRGRPGEPSSAPLGRPGRRCGVGRGSGEVAGLHRFSFNLQLL